MMGIREEGGTRLGVKRGKMKGKAGVKGKCMLGMREERESEGYEEMSTPDMRERERGSRGMLE